LLAGAGTEPHGTEMPGMPARFPVIV
jgi:hypothetical protein